MDSLQLRIDRDIGGHQSTVNSEITINFGKRGYC